jgi:hypothetical protein
MGENRLDVTHVYMYIKLQYCLLAVFTKKKGVFFLLSSLFFLQKKKKIIGRDTLAKKKNNPHKEIAWLEFPLLFACPHHLRSLPLLVILNHHQWSSPSSPSFQLGCLLLSFCFLFQAASSSSTP